MAGIELTVKKLEVLLDIPGTTQAFRFTENIAKVQLNSVFVPAANGAANKIVIETRNNNLSGFRWVQETANGDTSGTYKLYKFLNDDQAGTEIFSFDQSGNASFANNLTVNGTINTSLQLPATVIVNGATQTFQYNNNHISTFTLFNNQAPAIGNDSLVVLNMKNSANGGFRLAHTYQLTDSAGLGSLDLKIFNSSNVAINVMSFGVDGGGIPTVTSWGNTNLNGNNIFNQGGIGLSSFQGPVTFTSTVSVEDPILPQHAVNLGYLETYVSNAVNTDSTTLTGAVTGTGTTSINTALNSSISISGASQLFSYASQAVGDYIIQNLTAPTAGNPKSVRLNILNSTGGGYRFAQTHSNTDTAGLSQLKLQAVNNVGVSIDVFTAIINGSGVPEITFPGNMNYSGNNIFNFTSGLSAFYGPTTFYSPVSGQTPTLDEHLATKYYVDNSITSGYASTPITLTGAVTGINSISNPIFTSLANTIPLSGATQTWNFSLNSNVNYKIVNTLSPTTGTPSSVAMTLTNSTGGGYRHYHSLSSTDVGGLGTYSLQAISNLGIATDIYSVSFSGFGVPTISTTANTSFSGNNTFGATNTFNGDVSFNAGVNFPSGYTFGNSVNFSNTVTFTGQARVSVNQASYAFDVNNTNASGITEYTISQTIPYVSLGSNSLSGQSYIDSKFNPFYIRMAGVNLFAFSSVGNLGIGITGPTQAKLVIQDGVVNIGGEHSAIRTISSLATKIELQCTAVSGKLYEIRSLTNGNFDITDRTASVTRLTLSSTGNLGIGTSLPNAALQFSSIAARRKIVLYEAANNDHQNYSLGILASTFIYQVDQTTSDHVFYAGTSPTTSNELMRVKGTGGIQLPTSGGTAATLDHYEDFSTTGTWSGFTVASASKTLRVIRTGKQIALYLQSVSGTVTVPGALGFSVALPARFRPTNQQSFVITVLDNNAVRIGILNVSASGSISIVTTSNQGAQTAFTSGQCGLAFDVAISYMVA